MFASDFGFGSVADCEVGRTMCEKRGTRLAARAAWVAARRAYCFTRAVVSASGSTCDKQSVNRLYGIQTACYGALGSFVFFFAFSEVLCRANSCFYILLVVFTILIGASNAK